eukprot:TRINITY_DN2887_c0_g1_i1.p1 TRINITY_DN2887_c0_g1~~TRINITY_DN2887_c0_g1_i1.p1  ORF type:complete len:265 (+),score=76.87 TRINITY_DN2887_c0_g1_i1:287-1081(+)
MESDRVKLTLTIAIEKIDFDPGQEEMRISGPCVSENQHIKMGAYHTIDLALNKNFTVAKHEWDSVALTRLDEATNIEKNADAAAVVMNEGLAHVCLITGSMTILRARIECSVPKKKGAASLAGHDKAILKFYDQVVESILRHIRFDIVKAVIIASPGYVRDNFMQHMMEEAQRKATSVLLENKAKFLVVHSSSGHMHSLKEILASPEVSSKLADTKAAGEVKALDEFYATLRDDPSRAFYGWGHVKAANDSKSSNNSIARICER